MRVIADLPFGPSSCFSSLVVVGLAAALPAILSDEGCVGLGRPVRGSIYGGVDSVFVAAVCVWDGPFEAIAGFDAALISGLSGDIGTTGGT